MTKPFIIVDSTREPQGTTAAETTLADERAMAVALSEIRAALYKPPTESEVTDAKALRTEERRSAPALVPAEDLWSQTARALSTTAPTTPQAASAAYSSIIVAEDPTRVDVLKQRCDELKINLFARYKDTVKSVLFLGMSRGVGTSTAAFNFARSIAQDTEARVLLINADLRKPDNVAPDARTGLTAIASASNANPQPARVENIHVLPGGRGLVDPAVLFQSKRFAAFMEQCAKDYDYVVVDGPPMDEAPESIALCTNVHGVVLVMDARATRRRSALRAKQRIEDVGGKILGVALNRRRFYIPQWLYRLIA